MEDQCVPLSITVPLSLKDRLREIALNKTIEHGRRVTVSEIVRETLIDIMGDGTDPDDE